MGLSIYYSGTLRDPEHIDAIISEAADIGQSMNWSITELPSAPDIPVRGIVIQPDDCDPIWFTFHTNGNLCSPILFSYLLENEVSIPEDAKQVLVTKTQYAGADVHMSVIKFMRYLSEKYFSVFELTDESRFWETSDEQLCRKRFSEGDRIMDLLDLTLRGAGKYSRQKKYSVELKKRLTRPK